jgi:hypothetical protein
MLGSDGAANPDSARETLTSEVGETVLKEPQSLGGVVEKKGSFGWKET